MKEITENEKQAVLEAILFLTAIEHIRNMTPESVAELAKLEVGRTVETIAALALDESILPISLSLGINASGVFYAVTEKGALLLKDSL